LHGLKELCILCLYLYRVAFLHALLCVFLLEQGFNFSYSLLTPCTSLRPCDDNGFGQPFLLLCNLLGLLLFLLLVALPESGHRGLQQRAILRVEFLELAWLDLDPGRGVAASDVDVWEPEDG
jgi:hypothetical protein